MGLISSLVGPVLPYIQDKSFVVLFFASIFSLVIVSVVVNVVSQLLFKDNNKPPMVFHWFPFIGSTILYGIDPYKFFFDCREKVSGERNGFYTRVFSPVFFPYALYGCEVLIDDAN